LKYHHSIIKLIITGLLSSTAFSEEAPRALPSSFHGSLATISFSDSGSIETFEPGARLFDDRVYTVRDCPEPLFGLNFWCSSIDLTSFEVMEDGLLLMLTPYSDERGSDSRPDLEASGFEQFNVNDFQLFGEETWDRVLVYGKEVAKGESYRFDKWVVALGFVKSPSPYALAWRDNAGEVLYNGIVLPEAWPPNIDPADTAPMPVPYLDFPPDVIPIDIGRQLLVDDFLIEYSNLKRVFHMPEKYAGNPVLKPETALETIGPEDHVKPYGQGNAGAAPKSGGVWWHPEEQQFRMWYETSWFGPIAMATSKDGLQWERPEFDIRPGTNQVSPLDIVPDSWTVAPDWETENPEARWTLYIQPPGPPQSGLSLTSPDGIHWNHRTETGITGDRSTHFYNPFRKKWVYSLRTGIHHPAYPVERGRARLYYETDDFMAGAQWHEDERVIWLMADHDDPIDYLTRETPQLYNFDAVAYESIMLGFFQIHHGPHNKVCVEAGLPKITELNFAYSRDGFHWDRPDRRIHIPAERRDVWDRGYIQSVGGICTIMGDMLYFYYIGYQGNTEKTLTSNGLYDRSATGVAMLRRDGFASMNAQSTPGILLTRPITFSGKYLFVNAMANQGILRAEIQDLDGNPIAPYTLENSVPFSDDSTIAQMHWNSEADLTQLAGQPVRILFELTDGALYAFWISQDASGRSDGYVAAGGPGYTGPTDTVGMSAMR